MASYLDTARQQWEEGNRRLSAEVRSLRAERDDLARRVADSDTPEALARRARRLGLVKRGERLFIIKGIDEWRRRNAGSATGTSIGDGG